MGILTSHVYDYDPHPGGLVKIGNVRNVTGIQMFHHLPLSI